MNKKIRKVLIVGLCLLVAGSLLIGTGYLLGAKPENILRGDGFRLNYSLFDGNFGFQINGHSINFTSGVPRGYKEWDNERNSDNVYNIKTGDISSLDLKWIAGSAEIETWEGDSIKLSESADRELDETEYVRYGKENGVLYVQYCSPKAGGELPVKDIKILIPSGIAQKLLNLECSSASANMSINGVKTEKLDVSVISGEIQVRDIEAEEVWLESTSGDIDFRGSYSSLNLSSTSGNGTIISEGSPETTNISSTSGDISLGGDCGQIEISTISGEVQSETKLLAKGLNVDTTSGDVDLEGELQKVDVDTISGLVSLKSDVCPNVMNIESTSGNVKVLLPQDSGFTLEHDSVSGNFKCGFAVLMKADYYVSGSGSLKFEIETVSGDTTINPIE